MSGRMAGKSVIVYGAGSIGPGWGNGKAAAVLYARQGAYVLCADIDEAAAAETVAIISREGGEADVFVVDTTDQAMVRNATAQALQRRGKVDVVHYNVGISHPGDLEETPMKDWERVFSSNLSGALYAVKAALPSMRERRAGAFVFISSVAAVASSGYRYASYEASKAALNRLAQSLAVEHAADGIRANVVMPGLIDTPHVAHHIAGRVTAAQDFAQRRASTPPMKRQGTARDVAHAALFLASDEAAYITGVTLAVDGGLTLLIPSR
ncbi:MAG: SDR family NAD(P)-dependent oxidoreductase [Pseudomonadota bacterium]